MSFYSDWLHYKNNQVVEENSHSEQELLTELNQLYLKHDVESLAYKIDRYMYSEKTSGLLVGLAFGLLLGLVLEGCYVWTSLK